MKTVRLFAICVAALVFAVSSTAQPGPKVVKPKDTTTKKACTEDDCTLTVTFNTCADAGIDMEAFTIEIAPGKGKTVEWTLTGNAKFTNSGVNFKQNQSVFQNPTGSNQKFKWNNKHTDKGTFQYNIDVDIGGGQVCRLDPIIVNN